MGGGTAGRRGSPAFMPTLPRPGEWRRCRETLRFLACRETAESISTQLSNPSARLPTRPKQTRAHASTPGAQPTRTEPTITGIHHLGRRERKGIGEDIAGRLGEARAYILVFAPWESWWWWRWGRVEHGEVLQLSITPKGVMQGSKVGLILAVLAIALIDLALPAVTCWHLAFFAIPFGNCNII